MIGKRTISALYAGLIGGSMLISSYGYAATDAARPKNETTIFVKNEREASSSDKEGTKESVVETAPDIPEVYVREKNKEEDKVAPIVIGAVAIGESALPCPTLEGVPSEVAVLPFCPTYEGMKACENYRAITVPSSLQYKLQQAAYTDESGLRKIEDRYLVAIGTRFNAACGTYFDVILENGTVIPAIVGDIKADIHTDVTNTYSADKCATEFIIDLEQISDKIWLAGDASYNCEEWKSKAVAFRIYQKNYFEESESADYAA